MKTWVLVVALMLWGAGLAWTAQCRDSVWCRYHDQEAYLTVEWEMGPTGDMWHIYEHMLVNGSSKHRLLVACD